MTQQIDRPLHGTEKITTFHNSLDNITSRVLTPDNISTYAETALSELIELVSDVSSHYDDYAHPFVGQSKEREEAAFIYFGLDVNDIESTLDHVADKAEEIRNLDGIINQVLPNADTIFVPPDNVDAEIVSSGAGLWEEKQTIPRLKTILFILSNQFNIDVSPINDEVAVTAGTLTDKMMRKQSYFMVDVKSLDRTILVCDEEGNRTFIFDSNYLEEVGISQEDLISLSKLDLKELIADAPEMGRHFTYDKDFVAKVIEALENPINSNVEQTVPVDTGKFLQKDRFVAAPDGYRYINSIADELGVSVRLVYWSIDELGEELGEVRRYKFTNNVTKGYSEAQQAMISDILWRFDKLADTATDEITNTNGIVKLTSVSAQSVAKAVEQLGDELGEVKLYKFKTCVTSGFDAVQQNKIIEKLSSMEIFGVKMPEGYLTIGQLAAEFGMHEVTLQSAVNKIGDSLGDVGRFKKHTSIVDGYSPEQQRTIERFLGETGRLNDIAPESFIAVSEMARSLEISEQSIQSVIADVQDKLGTVSTFKSTSGRHALYYSPSQQECIVAALVEKGLGSKEAPEGINSALSLSKKLNISTRPLNSAIEALTDRLGELKTYRFGSRYSIGFDHTQERIIEDYLFENGYFTHIPEGYLSIKGIADKLGSSNHFIYKLVRQLGDELGTVLIGKRDVRVTKYFSPEQQSKIQALFEASEVHTEKAPAEVLSIPGMAKVLGMGHKTIVEYIEEAGDAIDPLQKYKFNTTVGLGLTPMQQRQLVDWMDSSGKVADKPPEGYIPLTALAEKIGISSKPIIKAINDISDTLGEVKTYRFSSHFSPGYSPEQQELIRSYLEQRGYFIDDAPEGYVSKRFLAKSLHTTDRTLMSVVSAKAQEIGNVGMYKFNGNRSEGFSPEQAAVLRTHFDRS